MNIYVYAKLCLIINTGNTWSVEGENWEEGGRDNDDYAGLA